MFSESNSNKNLVRIRMGNHSLLTRNPNTVWLRYGILGLPVYTFYQPWKPYRTKLAQLPLRVYPKSRPVSAYMREPLYKDFRYLRSPERDTGLRDALRKTSKVKEFRLGDALAYSYMRDTRFLLLTCLILGFALWWCFMPEPLVLKPDALKADNLGQVVQVCKDAFLDRVCSSHHIKSPCDLCIEPLKKMARNLFPVDEFDPLGINKAIPNERKVLALACYITMRIIGLTLSESISIHGIRVPFERLE